MGRGRAARTWAKIWPWAAVSLLLLPYAAKDIVWASSQDSCSEFGSSVFRVESTPIPLDEESLPSLPSAPLPAPTRDARQSFRAQANRHSQQKEALRTKTPGGSSTSSSRFLMVLLPADARGPTSVRRRRAQGRETKTNLRPPPFLSRLAIFLSARCSFFIKGSTICARERNSSAPIPQLARRTGNAPCSDP